MGSFVLLRFLTPVLLLAHVALRIVNPNTNLFVDLFLYNAVAIAAQLLKVKQVMPMATWST